VVPSQSESESESGEEHDNIIRSKPRQGQGSQQQVQREGQQQKGAQERCAVHGLHQRGGNSTGCGRGILTSGSIEEITPAGSPKADAAEREELVNPFTFKVCKTIPREMPRNESRD